MIVYISLERWAWKGRSMWDSVMGGFKEEVAFVKLQEWKPVIICAKQNQRRKCRELMCAHQARGQEGGMNWGIGTDVCTLLILCIKQITNENLIYSSGNSIYSVLFGDPNGKEIQNKRDIYICIADSLWCTAETNTVL